VIWTLPWMLVAFFPVPVAQAAPLETAPCRAALDLLAQEEDAAIARRSGLAPNAKAVPSRLRQLQRDAARVCLGESTAGEPPGAALPPRLTPFPGGRASAVSPPGTIMPDGVAAAASKPPAAAVQQRPLVTISHCDPQGCWASDGTRVQIQGSLLIGPRGYCTRAGAVLSCP
jgi:hypothetical protein